jgi:hypothetical protein
LDGLATFVILLQLGGIQLTNTWRLKAFGWGSNLRNPSADGWDPVNKYFVVKNLWMG